MPAATLEQSSTDALPVFVAGGRRRNGAVRLAAATLGLLLGAWLVALAVGLIGFSPLPKLALPLTDTAQTAPPPDQASEPGTERDAGASASPIAAPQAPGGGEVRVGRSGALPGGSISVTGTGGGRSGGGSSASTSPATGGGTTQPQPTGPGAGTGTQASSGHPPSFTPPASGQKSANPPRGKSANAPGGATSADPPGKATRTRPHSG
jgi:hypothetical protein